MARWTKAGLLISGEELLTKHGKVMAAMADEIARLNEEIKHHQGNVDGLVDWVMDLKKQLGHFDEDKD